MGLLDAIGQGIMSLNPLLGVAKEGFNVFSQYQNRADRLALQKQTWEREDTAVQRRAADLKAAGLNPVLAAGSAAQTSSPIQLNAPQVGDGIQQGADYYARMIKQKEDIARSSAERELLGANVQTAVQAARNQKLAADYQAMANQIKEHDTKLILASPVRSDVMTGLTGQIQQLVNAVGGALKKGDSWIGPLLEFKGKVSGNDSGGFGPKPPPGYHLAPNGQSWVKDEMPESRVKGSDYANKQGFTPKSRQYP